MRIDRSFVLLLCVTAALACSDATSPPVVDMPADTPDASPPPSRPDAEPPLDMTVVRFIVMGDTGEGNDDQYAVADAIESKCAADGCDFVILLGDNFYEDGVESVDDPQWQTKFEDPYANIDLPFYAVLGNHDYHSISNDWERGPIQVQYSEQSDKWMMPDTHYTFTWGPVGFIMLDTNSLFWDNTENGDQEAWFPSALAEVSSSQWIFSAGHHTYRSNGKHGDAGDYEAQVFGDSEISITSKPLNGIHIKDFLDENLCGTADFYFAGHDHNRQWINEPEALCGTELIVSGAGAQLTDKKFPRNEVHFEEYDTEGFFYVVVEGNELTGQFIDKNGVLGFERSVTK